jgi:glycosyltransferase involved in cell wall biosynthesis
MISQPTTALHLIHSPSKVKVNQTIEHTISVIIPVYNAGRFLVQAIESVLDQTHPADQVIVIDDGSTDDSVAIAQRYQRHIHLEQQPNSGSAHARNRGIALAHGKWLAFLDADDYWAKEKLSLQVATLQESPHLEAVFGQIEQIQMAEAMNATLSGAALGIQEGYHLDTMLIRQSAFQQIGGFDPNWLTDAVEWFVRAEQKGLQAQVIPQVLAWRRIHGDNLGIRERTRARSEYARLIKKRLDHQRRSRLESQ